MANNTNFHDNYSDFHSLTHENPRRKRKFLRMSAGDPISKSKKADPSAPKITEPCSECGKRFWSDKALYGHMRCHPERQWRGIKRPPTFRRPAADPDSSAEEDHEVALCLLLLANGPPAASDTTVTPEYSDSDRDDAAVGPPTASNCGRFECSSCKKVFGSHQALGGHRASHKNVKGCYAITKTIDGEEQEGCCSASGEMMMMVMLKDHNTNTNTNCNSSGNGHKCSICFRVFASGQALGGHMRCHWEKVEEQQPSRICEFDLNLAAPPPLQDDDDASSLPYSAGGLALDLRLGF